VKSLKYSDEAYAKQVDLLTEDCITGSQRFFREPLQLAEAILLASSSYEEAGRRVNELADQKFIANFGQYIFHAQLGADAIGRSQIVEKDRFYSSQANINAALLPYGNYTISSGSLKWFACADPVRVSFNLIPEDAIRFLREKSFAISGVTNQELLDAIQEKLAISMRDGTSYKDFAAQAREMVAVLGYTGDSPIRLQTIFRTNMFSAYSMAQLEQVEAVKDRFPLWQYVAVNDAKTRPMHRELNGKIFRQGEGPFPPIDYNCRCTGRFIHVTQTAGLKPVSKAFESKLMKDSSVVNFDQRSAFQDWFKQKQEGMNPAIKKAIASNV
jgi:SPP1 gp7 family putative phage head morphogenesis protein